MSLAREIPDTIQIGTSNNTVQRWHDLEAQDIQNRLWYGDPSCGWEGDPNLLLTRDAQGWVLVHLGTDAQWYIVCRQRGDASPGALQRLPAAMVAMDERRQDVEAKRLKDNEILKAAQHAQRAEEMAEPLDRVYYGLRKDIGYMHGITSKQFFAVGGVKNA